MVKMSSDCPSKNELREITFRYDPYNKNDKRILKMIDELLDREQPTCFNCENYRREGYFCGYCASNCVIHGNIEGYDNPHRDCDGSKCEDYKRKTE